MIVLGLDCAGKTASAALMCDDRILAETNLNLGYTHSETLLPMLDGLFSMARVKPDQVDLFAVTIGPGSFTGLRIGLATIKGMAFVRDIPCCGVSTLEAAAFGLRDTDGLVCAALDARCGQVYNAVFEAKGGKIARLCDDRAILIDRLGLELSKQTKPIRLCGDGAALCFEKLTLKTLCPVSEGLWQLRASSACRLALERPQTWVRGDALQPSYLRLPQAERERLEKAQKPDQ